MLMCACLACVPNAIFIQFVGLMLNPMGKALSLLLFMGRIRVKPAIKMRKSEKDNAKVKG
ncbi:hypothetical protein HMPREF1991_01397 [Hoylesella loescheii DSM 19665 = JCM 12249 = ATCC 15930]|uniref:Uncharacterized protein n=1 Tax=Hoylesella loescheii DSM 19665 = JCM 12249 = ATCC 15930 TaxID=1122985 RepID=A0A069QKE0_HOYLO|nr:hypothetical protein HMPREF1991_01397 [Hoylesella loescheii DSM 19665 = JCM 12249 = ATCC 15930]